MVINTDDRAAALMKALNEVLEASFRCRTRQEHVDACLEAALEMTGSSMGWLSGGWLLGGWLSGPDDSGNDFAIRLEGFVCRDKSGLDGKLWEKNPGFREIGRIIEKTGRPFSSGDSSEYPEIFEWFRDIYPIENLLAAGLGQGNEATGLIAVANRTGGYDAPEVDAFVALSGAVNETLLRRQAEEELEELRAMSHKRVHGQASDVTAERLSHGQPPASEIPPDPKEIMSALQAEKNFSDSIIDSLPGVFYLFGADFRFKRWNDNFESVTGYSSEEIAQISPLDLFDGIDRPRVAERIQEVFEKGKSDVEAQFLTKSGEKVPHLFTGHISTIAGAPYLVGLGIDISDRKLAEQKLLIFQMLVENANQGIGYADLTGEVKYLNSSLVKSLGIAPDEDIKKYNLAEFHPEEVQNAFTNMVIPSVLSKGKWSGESELLGADGKPMPVIENLFLVKDPEGRPLRIADVIVDISRMKAQEEERNGLIHDLGERVKELRCMFGVASSIRKRKSIDDVFEDVIKLIPSGWHYPEITRAAIQFDGKNHQLRDFEPTPWHLSADIVVAGQNRGRVEVFLTEERPDLVDSPFLQEERELIDGIAKALSEFIERHTALENLRESEERFRAIFELGLVGLAVTSLEKGWLDVNDSLCDTLGYTREELKETTWDKLTHPDDIAGDVAHFERLLAREIDGYSLEKRYIRKDGQIVYANLVVRCVRKPDGAIDYVVALVQDITRRKKAEMRLQETMADLERSNKELEQFAYVASHDLQEPLRMVASYTQLLKQRYEGRLDEKADIFIGFAVDGARRMQALINDLLALSRVGTRGAPPESVDCTEILESVLKNLEKAIQEKGVEIQVEPLPAVMADKSQLTQLFQNIIENAIKFCDKPVPLVKISARPKDQFWQFEISDNGIGIDPRYHDRIFVIFQRLHERDLYSGSGMGLTIAKKIVQRHGGAIHVESSPETGSTFVFTLPSKIGNGEMGNGKIGNGQSD